MAKYNFDSLAFDNIAAATLQPDLDFDNIPAISSSSDLDFDNILAVDTDPIGLGEGFMLDAVQNVPGSLAGLEQSMELVAAGKRLQTGDYTAGKPPTIGVAPSPVAVLRDPFSFGYYGAISQISRGGFQAWTPKRQKEYDQQLITKHSAEQEERSRRGFTTLGKAGHIAAQMPSIMLDWWGTGGFRSAASQTTKRAMAKSLRRYATTNLGKAAIATSGAAAGVSLRAAGLPHRAVEAVARRQVPRGMKINDDGSVEIEGPVEGMMESTIKGLADHWITIAVEQSGEVFGPAFKKGFGFIGEKLPIISKLLPRMQKAWMAKGWGRTIAAFNKKVSTLSGFNGTVSELGEEWIDNNVKAVLAIDDFGAGDDTTWQQRIVAANKNFMDNVPAMALAFLPFGVARGISGLGSIPIQEQIKKREVAQAALNQAYAQELDAPTEIETAEGSIGYDSGFFVEKYLKQTESELPTALKEAGVGKYFTPKWLVNRLVGAETLLEDVETARIAMDLERNDWNKWIGSITKKLKKEKDLARLPALLEQESEKESRALLKNQFSGEAELERQSQQEGILSAEALSLSEIRDRLDKAYSQGDIESFSRIVNEEFGPVSPSFEKNTLQGMAQVLQMEMENRVAKIQPAKAGKKTKAHILQEKIGDRTNPIHIMRDLLDTYEDAPAFLNESETSIFNQIRSVTRYMLDRVNRARVARGEAPIEGLDAYITHWLDAVVEDTMARAQEGRRGILGSALTKVSKKISNPTAERRKLRGDIEQQFSKDLGKSLQLMIKHDLRDIYILAPYQAALAELNTLDKMGLVPTSTYRAIEDYLRYDIRDFEAPLDKLFNSTMRKYADLLERLTFGKVVIDDPARQVLGAVRKLGFLSGLGFRLKAPLRNLGQRLLLQDLYRSRDYAKAQAVAAHISAMPQVEHPQTGEMVNLYDLIKEQDWYKTTIQKFEDIVDDAEVTQSKTRLIARDVQSKSFFLYRKSHAGNLFLSNVEVSALTGYFDWQHNYEQSKPGTDHFKKTMLYATQNKINPQQLLTGKEDMMWSIREAVRRTQWEYFATSMPTIYRGQTSRAAFQFQSWIMNYYFNHIRGMTSQLLTGRNDRGRLIPGNGRLRALKGMGTIVAIGKVIEKALGIAVLKFLFLPDLSKPLSAPIPNFILAVAAYWGADNDKDRKIAWKQLKRAFKFWMPYSLAMKDIWEVLSGEQDFDDVLFYKKKKKK
ncbi:hypothetical protein LCGC14_0542220 [marine sediment metagenome]|uniref:Large polyvalent protein associated domain-containing protein n=1 Tax=marine sediment metagenome TaxID=412755 RepID=A0A0F9SAV5_9ZZZZ